MPASKRLSALDLIQLYAEQAYYAELEQLSPDDAVLAQAFQLSHPDYFGITCTRL